MAASTTRVSPPPCLQTHRSRPSAGQPASPMPARTCRWTGTRSTRTTAARPTCRWPPPAITRAESMPSSATAAFAGSRIRSTQRSGGSRDHRRRRSPFRRPVLSDTQCQSMAPAGAGREHFHRSRLFSDFTPLIHKGAVMRMRRQAACPGRARSFALLGLGCGSTEGPYVAPTVPVKGKVTYKGKP